MLFCFRLSSFLHRCWYPVPHQENRTNRKGVTAQPLAPQFFLKTRSESMKQFTEILSRYLLPQAVEPVYALIVKHGVHLVVSKKRNSKLGDFRPGVRDGQQRISVNYNLNPYSFLLTFLHELAHQIVWKKHKNKVRPHGEEWQNAFKQVLQPFLTPEFFTPDILEQLTATDWRVFASSLADTRLSKTLRKYDQTEGKTHVEDLPVNALFSIPDGRIFQKLEKRRKNYLCFCLSNKKKYVFNPIAEVIPVENHP